MGCFKLTYENDQTALDQSWKIFYTAQERNENGLKKCVNYYAFGWEMPGRKFSGVSYRYGFNGKEKDDEVQGEGNTYDYGFRIYNSRLGKFLSVDPLAPEYPYYSPYHFAGNSPIKFIDLDGLEPTVKSVEAYAKLKNISFEDAGTFLLGIYNQVMATGVIKGRVDKFSKKKDWEVLPNDERRIKSEIESKNKEASKLNYSWRLEELRVEANVLINKYDKYAFNGVYSRENDKHDYYLDRGTKLNQAIYEREKAEKEANKIVIQPQSPLETAIEVGGLLGTSLEITGMGLAIVPGLQPLGVTMNRFGAGISLGTTLLETYTSVNSGNYGQAGVSISSEIIFGKLGKIDVSNNNFKNSTYKIGVGVTQKVLPKE